MSAQKPDNFVDDLFSALPKEVAHEVDVPSKSRFYNLSDGKRVRIKPMSWETERSLAHIKKTGIEPVNYILSECVENVDLDDILLVDKLYLIIQIRALSYGDEFRAIATCEECHTDTDLLINLTDLPVSFIPDEWDNPREVTLPTLGTTAMVKFPTVAEEDYTMDVSGANLWRFVTELGGSDNKVHISKALLDDRFPVRDAASLMKGIYGAGFGVQTLTKFVCPKCGHHNVTRIPFNQDFFTVS